MTASTKALGQQQLVGGQVVRTENTGKEAGGRTSFHVGPRKDFDFFPSKTGKDLRVLRVVS